MSSAKPKAIIFDCFGVVLADALSVLCAELRITDPTAVGGIWALIDAANRNLTTSEEASRQIASMLGMSYEAYRSKLQEGEIKDQVLLDYVKVLRKSYKTAMLSNIPLGSLGRRFSPGELEKYFDVVVASGEIGYAKPEAQAYEITADRLGVRLDECIFTDDRLAYCEGAQAVGMQIILYTNFAQFRADLDGLLGTSRSET